MDEVTRAAVLSKLIISEEEKQKAASDLERMLEYFEILKSADVSGLDGSQDFIPVCELRDDETVDSGMSGDIAAAAPASHEGMFVVPKTV